MKVDGTGRKKVYGPQVLNLKYERRRSKIIKVDGPKKRKHESGRSKSMKVDCPEWIVLSVVLALQKREKVLNPYP